MANKDNIRNTRKAQRATKPVVTTDWTSDKAMTPYYDHENKRYAVTVTLRYENAGQNFRRAYPDEFVAEGVNKILSFYNKTLVDGITPGSIASAMDFFVPERPRAKVRVSVGIPQDKFDNPNFLTDSVLSAAGSMKATEDLSINTYNLTKKMAGLSDILMEFHSQIKKIDGKVHGIDLKDEAENVSALVPVINNLIEANGYLYSEKRSDLFSLGVDSSYRPVYAQFNQGKDFNDLRVEFGKFQNSRIVKNSQSIYYMSKLDEIYGANKSVPPMNWEQFIRNFTIKEFRIELGSTRPYSAGRQDPNARVTEQMNQTPLKTATELKKEGWRLASAKRKADAIKIQSNLVSNVESGILSNLKDAENSLVGLESTYSQFLHRYQLTYIVKQAIICADPDGVIARTYAQVKQFLRDANRFVEDLIDVLKIPTISLDDLIPTIDIIGDIGKQIFLAIMDALKVALSQMLIEIVEMIISSCGNPDKMNFGALKISELLNDPTSLAPWTDLASELGDRALKVSISGIDAGINTFSQVGETEIGGITAGINAGTTGEGQIGTGGLFTVGGRSGLELAASKKFISNIKGFLGNEQIQQLIDDGTLSGGEGSVKQLLNEVSAVLTPGEVSQLLLRGGTPETKTMVQSIVSQSDSYSPTFKAMLSDDNQVADFFTSAGKLIDEDKLLEKVSQASNLVPDDWGGLCSDDPNEELRKKLLEGKGLTQDEIDNQIQKANERRRKRLEQLQNILEKDNPLDGAMPSTYCSIDEDGNVKPGLVDLDHPAFTFTLKKTINTSMSSVYSAFNTDAAGFVPSLKRDKKIKDREIVRTLVPPNQSDIISYNDSQEDEDKLPIYMINPEFELYYSQGYRSPRNHPNLGSYPGPISFPAPYKLTTEILSQLTNEGGIAQSSTRQLSPDPDKEKAVQDEFGSATSIFLPEIKSFIAPGLQDNLAKIAATGSSYYYHAFVADPSRPFRNFDMSNNILKLSFETLLTQDISAFSANGSTDQELSEVLRASGREEVGITRAGSFGPSRWFIRYDAQGTTGLLNETYSVDFFAINDEGREISLANAINTAEELNPQALEVIRREGLWEPELAVQQVSHDQFAYGPSTAGRPSSGIGTQEFQFSQFADKAFREGSIIRKPGDPEFYERIGGVDFSILQELLWEQKRGEYRTLYIEIFKDFMTAFSSEISRSDLFEEGVLDLANLTPKLTQRQILEDCKDPHLLNIEEIKKIIENEYAITKCIENVLSQEDGLGTSAKNALEKALLGGAVVITIRLYALEVVLKTIFAFAEFNFSDHTDIPKLISVFIERKIVNETKKLGYSQNFVHEALESYNRLAELPNSPIETGATPDQSVAFDYYIRREMMIVQKKMNTIIGTKEDTTINSILSEGFIRCFDVPSGSAEARLSLDKIESFSKEGELDRELLNGALSDDAIAKRRIMSEPDSPYKFKTIIRNLGRDISQEQISAAARSARFGTVNPLAGRPSIDFLLNEQFEFTPIFGGPNINVVGRVGNPPTTLDLWPDHLFGGSLRPTTYDLPPIRPTTTYTIRGGQNSIYGEFVEYDASGDAIWGFGGDYYQTYANVGFTQGAIDPTIETFWKVDLSYEDRGNWGQWGLGNNSGITWEEIVDRDAGGNYVDVPPQFIGELWPLFTFTLAQSPNSGVGLNYSTIYPKFGFNDELSQSLAPNKTGFYQLFEPAPNNSDRFPEWFIDGLNNRHWWDDHASDFERDAMITMFEVFNNQNILLPGNAGASYTVPTGASHNWNAVYLTDATPGVFSGDLDPVPVREPLYKLVELPSPTYSRVALWPAVAGLPHHLLDWQHGNSGPGPQKLDSFSHYHFIPVDNATGDVNDSRISTFSNDPEIHSRSIYDVLEVNTRTDDQSYKIYKNSDLPIPPTSSPFQTPDGAPFLVEYSFHPKMLEYNIQDATIDSFPEDIQKEIDYYKSWSGFSDKHLLRELRRQFTSNRTQFRFSYTQNNKLLKVGEELLQDKWNGRPIPTIEYLEDTIKQIYGGMLGRKIPDHAEIDGRDNYGVGVVSKEWGSDIASPTFVGGALPNDRAVAGGNPRDNPAYSGFADPFNVTGYEVAEEQSVHDFLNSNRRDDLGFDQNQKYPRGYEEHLGLRGDLESLPNRGLKWGYTLIYILDQIRSRLRNFKGMTVLDDDRPSELGYSIQLHTYQTYKDKPSWAVLENTRTADGGLFSNLHINQQRKFGVTEKSHFDDIGNPRREYFGWVPGAGSPLSHWPPHLHTQQERNRHRFPYTTTKIGPDSGTRPTAHEAISQSRGGFTTVFNELKNNADWYTNNMSNLSIGLEAPFDNPEIYGEYQQWKIQPGTDARKKYKTVFVQLWELDFWMNKLTALMLLEPNFVNFRSLKDYPQFLEKVKLAAEHIRDQFKKDLKWRENEQRRIKDELGDVFNSRKPKGNILTMFMDNGGLIYEKYIRLKEKDWQALEDRITEAGTRGMIDTAQALTQLGKLKTEAEDRNNWLKGAVNIDYFQRWLQDHLTVIEQNYDEALEAPQQFSVPREVIGSVIPDEDCGEDLLVTRTLTDFPAIWDQTLSLNDLFEEASFGFRITAVASPHAELLIQKVKATAQTTSQWEFTKLTQIEKAYLMHEEGEYYETLDLDDTSGENIVTRKVEIKSDYVTIPLVSVELPIDPNLSLSELIGTVEISSPVSTDTIKVEKMRYLYNKKLPELLRVLRETDEFKFLFKYCFPVDRMFSLNLMYILLYLGQIPNVDKTFNNTKQTLKTVFNAFLNSGNYQYESDITNQTLDKYDMANPGDSPGVDLWSIAKNFSLMAFRAITEMVDPNIQLSRFIYNGLETGVSAANSVFGEECGVSIELPPGTFFAISWGLLPINIFGAFGYGPPITPMGIAYDVVFGIIDPLASSATKNNQRCLAKKAGGRDFTNAIECNDDEEEATSSADTNIPYANEDDFAAGLVDKDGNPIPPEEQPPSSISAGPKYKGHVVSYIDERGRRRDEFGRVIDDDGNLRDVNGNLI